MARYVRRRRTTSVVRRRSSYSTRRPAARRYAPVRRRASSTRGRISTVRIVVEQAAPSLPRSSALNMIPGPEPRRAVL